MLDRFADEIWIADGPQVVAAAGFHYPTRMAVIRLADGALFIWSPVEISDALKAEVDALGRVAYLVAPNSLHHLYLGGWKTAYPHATIHAAPGLQKKRPDLRLDHELADEPPPAWRDQIDQVVVRGNLLTVEVVFFHRPSRTVLFTDLVQQFPEGWFHGWRRLIAKWDRMIAPEPTVPRKFRVAFTDRRSARTALARIRAWPADNMLLAHGTPVVGGARTLIARAFAWLDA